MQRISFIFDPYLKLELLNYLFPVNPYPLIYNLSIYSYENP